MYPLSMAKGNGQVNAIGNYEMTGKLLGKGNFARVEEAQHKIISKKVAVKIIDLSLVKEEYVKKNLHREPKVMSRLRHPCIVMLYETMMCGSKLFIVMEEANGGDLCTHVLAHTRSRTQPCSRGLHEDNAKHIATQLVSAIKHMHSCGVVHRDLKMENIMLDRNKQHIKIVDFGLSNLCSGSACLCTPCGSLEYAAPELFVSGKRYGPEVDLWSLGVIVFGMVTGGLPFTLPNSQASSTTEGKNRQLLQRIITKGYGSKQNVALGHTSSDCRTFVQLLLQPEATLRLNVNEASEHPWIKKNGKVMRAKPMPEPTTIFIKQLCKQISEVYNTTVLDIEKRLKTEPYGPIAGIYNIKMHTQTTNQIKGKDFIWSPLPMKRNSPSGIQSPNQVCHSVLLNSNTLLSNHAKMKGDGTKPLNEKRNYNLRPASARPTTNTERLTRLKIPMIGDYNSNSSRLPSISEYASNSFDNLVNHKRPNVSTSPRRTTLMCKAVQSSNSKFVKKEHSKKLDDKSRFKQLPNTTSIMRDVVTTFGATINHTVSRVVTPQLNNNKTDTTHSNTISKTRSALIKNVSSFQRNFRKTTSSK